MKPNKEIEVVIDGAPYAPKGSTHEPAAKRDGLDYVIIRSRDSGCHAGYLESESDRTVVLLDSRRLWYWEGAATLSQLAMEGVKKPESCKFPCVLPRIKIHGISENIPTTATAKKSIESVPVWEI